MRIFDVARNAYVQKIWNQLDRFSYKKENSKYVKSIYTLNANGYL